MKFNRKDLLTLQELPKEEVQEFLRYALEVKKGNISTKLTGKTLLTLLLTPSIHTRLAMEVVASQLETKNITLDCTREKWDLVWEPGAMMFSDETEHIDDVVKILERYGQAVAVRHIPTSDKWQMDRQDSIIKAFAKKSPVPVCNLGSSLFNPVQALTDIFTIKSHLQSFEGWKAALCWTYNPSNNSPAIANSLALAVSKFGMDLTIAHPQDFPLDSGIMKLVQKNCQNSGGSIEISHQLDKAVSGAHVVYAVNWQSLKYYNDIQQQQEIAKDLTSWNINSELMEKTDGGYLLHPLPVRRNVAVMEEVLQSNCSLVYEQAENWVHVQKAILLALLGSK